MEGGMVQSKKNLPKAVYMDVILPVFAGMADKNFTLCLMVKKVTCIIIAWNVGFPNL